MSLTMRRGNSNLLECQICNSFQSDLPRDRFVTTQCGHTFHEAHLQKWTREHAGAGCPVDQVPVELNKLVPLNGYDPSNRELKVKIAVLGDSGVGKTCLVKRFMTGVVNMNVLPTVPWQMYMRNLEVDFESVNLTIWEPAGSERFNTIIPQCLRDCHGVIFCYEQNHFQSLVNVHKIWKDLASRYIGDFENYVSILLECKNDMGSCQCEVKGDYCRPVTEIERSMALQLLGIDFFSNSARDSTKENLEAPFKHVIRQVLGNEKLMEGILNEKGGIQLELHQEKTKDEKSRWLKFKSKC